MKKLKGSIMFPSEVVIIPAIFFAFFMIIRTLSNNNVRKKIIERGLSEEQMKMVLSDIERTEKVSYAPIKFGLVFIVLGLCIVLVSNLKLYEETAAAVYFFGIGLVLVIFPTLEQKLRNK